MLEFLLVMGVVRQTDRQTDRQTWSRPDLKPDPNDRLSRVDYVHLYRDRREVTDIKISSYVGRTLLSTEGLGKGDISLKIYNVTLEDKGRFGCFIPKAKLPDHRDATATQKSPNS
ncbi:hypothetical protein F7725_004879 [Dissostichus mawsoni]|uniref:Uncharacterized protein n=1 Tax=Dissostichus mawsoni TaxID=36200 RepID=A0A7J5XK12_DISMA|nr:hypothetical protein F7725_004879 [Dissostichus mawsoni]